MVCYHPIKAFYPLYTDKQGKRYLKFGRNRHALIAESLDWIWKQEDDLGLFADKVIYDKDNPYPVFYNFNGEEVGLNITVPCGKCLGCRLDYSRNWAIRSTNEAFMHSYYNNCSFLTLTFNDDMLNRRENPHSLNKAAMVSWMKRFRKAVKAHYNTEFRFMLCGEYGTRKKRPHYHLIVYGFNFPDKYVFQVRKIKNQKVYYYRSPFLESIWRPAHSTDSFGFSVLGEVNFESSAYVARYVTKKLFGKYADIVYKDKEPEFLKVSRMPGLGYDFFKKYYIDIVRRGYINTSKGFKAPIPRYYIDQLKKFDPQLYDVYKLTQFENLCDNLAVENINSSRERLIVREELKKHHMDRLIRQYE